MISKKLISVIILSFILMLTLSWCGSSGTLLLSGTIKSTQIDANSEVSGRIIKLDKDEGMALKKNDVIATVDSSTQELAVKQQEAVVKLKQAKLDDLLAGSRSEQVDQVRSEVSAASTAVDNAKINYDYWLDKYNKTKTLRSSNAVSESDLLDAQYKLDTANQQLLTSRKQFQASNSQLDLLINGSTNQTIQAAKADLEQSQAALEQSKLTLSKYQIKSPVDGVYLQKNINIGDIVNQGSGIATISDLSDLWIDFYIPQRNLSWVKLDQEVVLKAVSLPGKSIKGKIIFIASEAEFTPKNTETSEAKENTVFKLKIKILDNIESLKPGMTIDANIPSGGK